MQILAAKVVDVGGVDVGREEIDVEGEVAKDAVPLKKTFQLFAQHGEGGEFVADRNLDRVDVLGMPDFAQHAGIDACVPHPARHQRIAFRRCIVQRLRREVAHPAVLAVGREACDEGGHAPVRRRDIGPAVEECDKALAHQGETVLAEPRANSPPDRRNEGAEVAKLGLGQFVHAPFAEHFLEERGLERQRADIALDATGLFGAFGEALESAAELRAGKIEHRPCRRRRLRCAWSEPKHHSAASRIAPLASASAATAAERPCAIESSIVSGPVAAPATKTPARVVPDACA